MRVRYMWIVAIVVLLALTSTAVALAQQRTHVVQPGETLYRIALRYGLTVEQLAAANGITNPSLIRVGQVLIIPGSTGTSGAGTTSYTVVAGDTLYSIARRFGTTVDRLVALNGLTNPNVLRVGQVLIVPSQGQPVLPTATLMPGGTRTPTAQPATTTPAPTAVIATPTPTASPTATPQGPVTYTVRPGDTLSYIALRFGTTIQQLVLLNGLTNPDLIYVGQVLIIRGGGTPTPAPTTTPTPRPTGTPTSTATVTPEPTSTPVVTPTNTPTFTPTATLDPNIILTPTPIVPDIEVPAGAPNLLANPGFEGEARRVGFDNVNVSGGWEPFYCDEPYTATKCPALRQGAGNPEGLLMGRPDYVVIDTAGYVHSGTRAQQWFCHYSACRAGVYQTVETVPGAFCEAGAYIRSLSTNGTGLTSDLATTDDRENVLWFIRVDLSGGTFAFAEGDSNILISRGFGYEDGVYDQYVRLYYTFTATGEQTTIYFENLRLWPLSRNVSYIDDAYLRCTESP